MSVPVKLNLLAAELTMEALGDDWKLELPPIDESMEGELVRPIYKESSPEKRHRSSESVSSSSDMLRMIVQSELHTVVSENIIPDVMQQLESRMAGLQLQNLELVKTANAVLLQVQQSFDQVRAAQQSLNDQLSEERTKALHHGQKLNQVMNHQEAQQHALNQTVDEARAGFHLLDQVVSSHEERLISQGQGRATDPISTRNVHGNMAHQPQFGQDDRGLGHTPSSTVFNPPTMHQNAGGITSPPASPDPMTGACLPPMQNALANWPHGVKVSPPPVLDPLRYVSWKKEFLFWRELYGFLPDEYLLSVMGSGSASSLRLMIMKMFHDTKMNTSLRSIQLLLSYLDSSYATTSREREMNALERLLDLRREGSETVQAFWLRFEAIMVTLENTSSILSSELVFMRALKSLQLSHQQKTGVLMMLDCQDKEHNVENLKNVSIRLFGMYRDTIQTKTDSKAFMTMDAEWNGDSDDSPNTLDQNAFIVRKTKPGRRNKPGMETNAIRASQSKTNMENGTLIAQKSSVQNRLEKSFAIDVAKMTTP